ncbi:MAG: MBL fold metallo-hydrolase [Kangiellaceae bacterium]|nr:MBL fold metallo-hydrolase [Kangiellaceae bacterium]
MKQADIAKPFQNNHAKHVDKGLFGYFRMKYFGDDVWPDYEEESKQVPVTKFDGKLEFSSHDNLQVFWVGHSTFLIHYNGVNVLTDPIFSERASPFSFAGPERLVDLPITIEQLPNIDIVVISHNHYDHLDEGTIKMLGNKPLYFVPEGLKSWFVDLGISDDRVTELAWWQESDLTLNQSLFRITALPCQHWSKRTLTDTNLSHWASWGIEFADKTLWFAGDTGYNKHDFQDIGKHYKSVDLALIPIGAYAPRSFMSKYHVNVDEAIMIHNDVNSKFSIGMHWGTFPLTAEPVIEPMQLLRNKTKAGLDNPFITLSIGQLIKLPSAD